jgi:L-ascorbate metabolism protein UlaG (beta-lactamase superfamily)
MEMKGVKITWLGHGTFLFESNGKTTLLDPWLAGNPSCPEKFHGVSPDLVLITHGHSDHIGNVFDVAERGNAPFVGIFDLVTWLGQKGVAGDRLVGMNKGGSVRFDDMGMTVTMVQAVHSSSFVEEDGRIVYLGEPAGFVIAFDGGLTVYAAGDTAFFGDMEWIGRLYSPQLAILPIGDRFTMDPRQAAWAAEVLDVDAVIPAHFGTFGLLTGTVEELRTELAALECHAETIALSPGESVS